MTARAGRTGLAALLLAALPAAVAGPAGSFLYVERWEVLNPQGGHESQWAAIVSVSSKIGCSAETLRKWVRRAERDTGVRPGLTSDERARLKALERENLELRRANEILRKASAYFAQAELDRRPRT